MCFSAQASFAIGTALLPAGGYCVLAAIRKRPRMLPLALAPVLFGLQQLGEGFVWIGLSRGDPALVRSASLYYLFFALVLWPLYFPFMTAWIESHPRKRRIFAVIAGAAIGWFIVLYYPIISGPDNLLNTQVVHHSIQYDYSGLPIYRQVPQTLLRILYFLCVAIPMAFGTDSLGRSAGMIFGASAVVAALAYDYAFVSVWCFFAAGLALYLCLLFSRLRSPEQTANAIEVRRRGELESA